MTGFGNFGEGPGKILGPRFECKVCWYVYEPAEGDVVWQIPAGTPFALLPPHWTCPNCSATKDQFLVLTDDDR
jgi:rubredoxin